MESHQQPAFLSATPGGRPWPARRAGRRRPQRTCMRTGLHWRVEGRLKASAMRLVEDRWKPAGHLPPGCSLRWHPTHPPTCRWTGGTHRRCWCAPRSCGERGGKVRVCTGASERHPHGVTHAPVPLYLDATPGCPRDRRRHHPQALPHHQSDGHGQGDLHGSGSERQQRCGGAVACRATGSSEAAVQLRGAWAAAGSSGRAALAARSPQSVRQPPRGSCPPGAWPARWPGRRGRQGGSGSPLLHWWGRASGAKARVARSLRSLGHPEVIKVLNSSAAS